MLSESGSLLQGAFSVTGLVYLLLAIVAVAAAVLVVRAAVRVWRRYRGPWVITCPDNQQHAAVKVDVDHVVSTSLLGEKHLRLSQCSRWPEKAGCGQECLKQVETQPEQCMLHSILANWYKGKTCAACGVPLDPEHWSIHKPALRSADGKTAEWGEIPPESVPDVIDRYAPLCWDCHIALKLRGEHPELVTERPWEPSGPCGERTVEEEDKGATTR